MWAADPVISRGTFKAPINGREKNGFAWGDFNPTYGGCITPLITGRVPPCDGTQDLGTWTILSFGNFHVKNPSKFGPTQFEGMVMVT